MIPVPVASAVKLRRVQSSFSFDEADDTGFPSPPAHVGHSSMPGTTAPVAFFTLVASMQNWLALVWT